MGRERIASWRRLAWALMCCGVLRCAGAGTHAAEPRPPAPDDQVARLIAELGSPQFVLRERAQQELQRLGAAAFDALLEAQHDGDIEIASRARYLLRGMRLPWTAADDPAEVKDIVRNYDAEGRAERQRCMARLAALDGSRGVPALCRLMRFEMEPALSKRAALFVLGHEAPTELAARARLANSIRSAVQGTARPAATWLAAYAHTLESPESALPEWERITAAETRVLALFPEESNPAIVRDLLRWRSEMLLKLRHTDDALAVLRQAMTRMGDSRQDLLDMLDWSLARDFWAVADELAARFPDQFAQDALLLYRWAEAQRKNGQETQAARTAQRALSLEPEQHERHIETARRLTERLLYDWAERELRQVVAETQPAEEAGLQSRFYLAELLFDRQQELASAQVLEETIQAIDKDPKILQNFNRSPLMVRALMHYRFAMHFAKTGDRQQQRQRLEEAIRQYPTDVDVLIAMHQFPEADAQWKRETAARIQAVGGRLREESRQLEETALSPVNQRGRSDVSADLASRLNQYAWLVSNTEGNLADALRASRRSVELFPDNSAFLDTQARCYYALGDLENAVRSQTRAAQLEPSSQQIRRQLERYQQELAEKRAPVPTTPSDP